MPIKINLKNNVSKEHYRKNLMSFKATGLSLLTVPALWTPITGRFPWHLFTPVESFRWPVMPCDTQLPHQAAMVDFHVSLSLWVMNFLSTATDGYDKGQYLLSWELCCIPLYALSHLILTIPWGKCSYYLYSITIIILESPLDCKEIKPLNPKGNQPWIFIGRTGAGTEALILWPPGAQSQVIGKDPDAGKDWRQKGWLKGLSTHP